MTVTRGVYPPLLYGANSSLLLTRPPISLSLSLPPPPSTPSTLSLLPFPPPFPSLSLSHFHSLSQIQLGDLGERCELPIGV